MSEQLSSNYDRLPELSSYWNGDYQFEPLDWETDPSLNVGAVLLFQDTSRDVAYLFECLALDGRKKADGFLTVFTQEGTAGRTEAGMSIEHPAMALSQAKMRYLEFTTEEEGRRSILHPIYDKAEIVRIAEIGTIVQAEARRQKIVESLGQPGVREAVEAIADYYRYKAEHGDPHLETFYEDIAASLVHELL